MNPQNDDIQYEVDKEGAANASSQDTADTGSGNAALASLREKLEKALAEKQEYLDGWQRTKAEFVNAKKRNEEDLKEYRKFAQENLIEELLPVLQSFDMAMANKEAWEKADKNWRTGVEYIASQFKAVLEANGLKEINPIGQKFDPLRDEAIENIEVSDAAQDHSILSVVQKGYELNGKQLRPPRVKVGEFKKA